MTLGAAILLIVIFVSVLGMWAYTSTVMYGWFVEPMLAGYGGPLEAAGCLLLIFMYLSYWSPKFEDTIWNMIYRPVLVLVFGWLLHIHLS